MMVFIEWNRRANKWQTSAGFSISSKSLLHRDSIRKKDQLWVIEGCQMALILRPVGGIFHRIIYAGILLEDD